MPSNEIVPAFNQRIIAPYVSKFVRQLHADDESISVPYSQKVFGALVMVDIVGFSKMTSVANELGPLGAEIISTEVGEYYSEAIHIIEAFGGDVVKVRDLPTPALLLVIYNILLQFLGDALLVCFSSTLYGNTPARFELADDIEQSGPDRRMKMVLVRRAMECGIQLLSRLRKHTIKFSPNQRYRQRKPTSDLHFHDVEITPPSTPPLVNGHSFPSLNKSRLKLLDFRLRGHADSSLNLSKAKVRRRTEVSEQEFELQLHVAVAAGEVTHVVIGNVGDESVLGDPSLVYERCSGRLEYAICGETVESLGPALAIAKEGEMTMTKEAWKYADPHNLDLTYQTRDNCVIIRHHRQWRNRPLDPILPRVRHGIQLPDATSYQFFKYINKSALYRLCLGDGNPAHLREVTILFMGLRGVNVAAGRGQVIAQKSIQILFKALDNYDGYLQQFAVDEKGATFLVVFGFPPKSHEKDATFATKAALDIQNDMLEEGIEDFSIALSTGVIFVGTMGNEFRRDPSIAGDAIVRCVRMLGLGCSQQSVVCDESTRKMVGALCEFEDMGERMLKGKSKPIRVWRVVRFLATMERRLSTEKSDSLLPHNREFIGYRTEMAAARDFIDGWLEKKNNHVLVLSGSTGTGKTYFAQHIRRTLEEADRGIDFCVGHATEVERGTKYYLFRVILLHLFELIEQNRVPPRAMRRSRGRIGALGSGQGPGSGGGYVRGSEEESGEDSDSYQLSPSLSARSSSDQEGRFPASPVEWSKKLTRVALFSPNPEVCRRTATLALSCLARCGEDLSVLPLLRFVFPDLSVVEESRQIANLDAQGRDLVLSSLIVRMVKYVSEHTNLIILCDDIQWADSASVKMLEMIHESCPKVFLLLASRPARDYQVTLVESISTSVGRHLEITLNGLGLGDIEQVVLREFGRGAHQVNRTILDLIQKRTGGNPLFIKNVALVLGQFSHVTVSGGELVSSSSHLDLEHIVSGLDYDRVIRMQFDRLHHLFQEFLRVASCLDQTFSVSEVRAVLGSKGNPLVTDDPVKIRELTSQYDVYRFLKSHDSDSVSNSSSEDSDSGVAALAEETYSFVHAMYPCVIYETIPFETRLRYHEMLAGYYESQLCTGNRPRMLTKIARHYEQTDIVAKKLHYLEELGHYHIQSYSLPEATEAFEKIVRLLDQDPELGRGYDAEKLSEVYLSLGECLSMRTKLMEAESRLLKALEIMGTPWPKNRFEFQVAMYRERLVQRRYRQRRPHPKRNSMSQVAQNNKRSERLRKLVRIFDQLYNIYHHLGKGDETVLSCVWGLNCCEKLAQYNETHALFLARQALYCWLSDRQTLSAFYIGRALRMTKKCPGAYTLTACANLCFAAGSWHTACDLLYYSIEAMKTMGVVTDCQAFYRAVQLLMAIRIFQGTLSRQPGDQALLRELATMGRNNDDVEAELWVATFQLADAIITHRLNDSEPLVLRLEAQLAQERGLNRIALHGVLAAYHARMGRFNITQRHFVQLAQLKAEIGGSSNTFPIFGLNFCTIALYDLVEAGVFAAQATVKRHFFDEFVGWIVKLNHMFQQVKYWQFTQPCLYLARALPYLSTGRFVEGHLVLHHGLREMDTSHEIFFLKAYYFAKLGRYTTSQSEREEWTARAKTEFERLGIDSNIYCATFAPPAAEINVPAPSSPPFLW
ncbi:uncharacterized protein VTP21DRAFT_5489 [Calcarisporiella thermophila]|uniref:uncharacterized protein n=1 Tax=Calcarisporiella thermophila TaxID=911321 RepID=UPI003741F0E0